MRLKHVKRVLKEHMWKEGTLLVFFFQAEDGIRDVAVTGVQTCALPISPRDGQGPDNVAAPSASRPRTCRRHRNRGRTASICPPPRRPRRPGRSPAISESRSEERRVGKECRSRWSPYY